MTRTRLNLLTVLSLLPCAAVCVSWAASYRWPHSAPLYRGRRERRFHAIQRIAGSIAASAQGYAHGRLNHASSDTRL